MYYGTGCQGEKALGHSSINGMRFRQGIGRLNGRLVQVILYAKYLSIPNYTHHKSSSVSFKTHLPVHANVLLLFI
jgi:hypothetical protein